MATNDYDTVNSDTLVCIEADYLDALEAVVTAAWIEVERSDRFGCRELRAALTQRGALMPDEEPSE